MEVFFDGCVSFVWMCYKKNLVICRLFGIIGVIDISLLLKLFNFVCWGENI